MIRSDFLDALRGAEIRAVADCDLSALSTFRIGGVCDLAVFPKTREECILVLDLLREKQIPFCVLGNGSNVLFGDGRLSGVLLVTREMTAWEWKGDILSADCGASLPALSASAAKEGMTGLEFARGIPGTLGGAMVMNAGAYGGQISDLVVESHAYDLRTGEIFSITEHGFGYRESVYLSNPNLFCLGATLRLREGDREEIEERMREYTKSRKEKQPLEYPSAGSYFKRPAGHFAGKLIEDCGLKGLRVGGAAVSEKHAGFLINEGGATAEDVLCLEEQVRRCVWERFGVFLEREVQFIESMK